MKGVLRGHLFFRKLEACLASLSFGRGSLIALYAFLGCRGDRVIVLEVVKARRACAKTNKRSSAPSILRIIALSLITLCDLGKR